MSHPNALTDHQILELLHLHENEGMTATQLAPRFGKSRSALLGLVKRVRDETNAVDVSPHLNGTMPPRWWKRRGRA